MSGLSRDKVLLICSILFVLVLIFKRGKQERKYELFIQGHQPKEVWDLLADFRNIARLNPRIRHWELGEEATSKGGSWWYSVTSTESMAGDWLLGPNINRGKVKVKTANAPHLFLINSDFITESFRGLFIIDNRSEMSFERVTRGGQKGTLFTERVFMDCPLLFTQLCNAETDANRKDFLTNLKYYYEL